MKKMKKVLLASILAVCALAIPAAASADGGPGYIIKPLDGGPGY